MLPTNLHMLDWALYGCTPGAFISLPCCFGIDSVSYSYSMSRKSLNKCLMSGRVLRLRLPTHRMQFALCSSACVWVRLGSSACVCKPSTVRCNFYQMQAIDMRWRPSYGHDLSIKHIQESSKVSQGHASSEHFWFVGGVSETSIKCQLYLS